MMVPLLRFYENSGLGTLARGIWGSLLNLCYPEFNLFEALALKSGLPGTPVFTFDKDGETVRIMPMGRHLDAHGEAITSLRKLRDDFFAATEGKAQGKLDWIRENRLIRKMFLSAFVFPEGPVRLHYLPKAKRLAVGGGRNRMIALMRFGFRNARQFKQAEWDEREKKYVHGDIILNTPGKPVWDDIPPGTDKQGWVDKTDRWDAAYEAGLRFTMGDIFTALFKRKENDSFDETSS